MCLLLRFFLACLATALGLLGGSQAAFAQAPPDGKPTPEASKMAAIDPSTYRVGAEDVLEIAVWHEDALKKEALVRPDGALSYPLIGDVQAAGRTVLEIRDEITKRLEKIIPDAVVSVTVLKIGSQRVYVLGKVNKPGEFQIGRYVDVLQALTMAGGLTSYADANDIRIMRREGERQVVLPFEYERVIRGQKIEQNVLLRPGDVVVVP